MEKQFLVKNFNSEENVREFTIAMFSIYFIDLHEMQGTLSVSLTNYPANFMEIDGIDAEYCVVNSRNIFRKIEIFG